MGQLTGFSEKLLESAPDAMVITNHAGTIIMINAQTERLFGFRREEIIGKKVEFLIPERYRKVHSHHRDGYIANPKVRGMGVGMELFGKRRDGTEFPVEISLSPVKIADEDSIIVISAIRDISKQVEWKAEIKRLNENLEELVKERTEKLELSLLNEMAARNENARIATENERLYREVQETNSELEQRVAKRTLALETINKELEAFSYSVSHDLRAPLRSIDGFCNKILKEYGHLLDEKGRDYFGRVRNASQKMGQLIDDLLKLSRISRVEMAVEKTNLSELAETIITELKAAFPERKALIDIQPEMIANADRNLMLIALQNLLSNAWKYSRNQPISRIEFGTCLRDNEPVFFVGDNGVGFDMKYVHKLFGAFQRLHGSTEFEGTGIGLATVQRIIQRHHGTIWAESEINKGATFFFTL